MLADLKNLDMETKDVVLYQNIYRSNRNKPGMSFFQEITMFILLNSLK